jgi:hypothetical protein
MSPRLGTTSCRRDSNKSTASSHALRQAAERPCGWRGQVPSCPLARQSRRHEASRRCAPQASAAQPEACSGPATERSAPASTSDSSPVHAGVSDRGRIALERARQYYKAVWSQGRVTLLSAIMAEDHQQWDM